MTKPLLQNELHNYLEEDSPHILVVDDDSRIRTLLGKFLYKNNCRVTLADDASKARNLMKSFNFDLLIVDVMMPGEDGLSLTSSIRKSKLNVPILILTALTGQDECIKGLEAGAHDYIKKPFAPQELLLRVMNWVERNEELDLDEPSQVLFGEFIFELTKRELRKSGDKIQLTDREKEFLYQFATNPGNPVSRLELVKDENEVNERTVDVQINHLRRKVEKDPTNPIFIQTVRGQGYRLAV